MSDERVIPSSSGSLESVVTMTSTTTTKPVQQIGQIDQPFRLGLLIRAERRPTVLLVEKRLQSPVESFGQV